jgi:hypothetical protein
VLNQNFRFYDLVMILKLVVMRKILEYTIAALVTFLAGCAGTADQPLSSPQDAQLLLNALPDEPAIENTVALTSVGKQNLMRIRDDLKLLATSTSKQKKDSRSRLTLSRVQKNVIAFTKKRNRDEWDNEFVNGINGDNCRKQCFSGFNKGVEGCNRLSGLSGASCSANILTIYLLCLSNCPGTVPK